MSGIEGRPGWHRGVLDLTWVAGEVGYTIERVRVEMRDDTLRVIFLEERTGADVAAVLGTVRVERMSSVQSSFGVDYRADSSYLGATVISSLLDDRGVRYTPQLSLAKNPTTLTASEEAWKMAREAHLAEWRHSGAGGPANGRQD